MRTAVLSIAALLVAGCGNTAGLEQARNAKLAERDRLARIAENLNEAQAKLAEADAEEKRMRVWRADGDAGTALKTVGEASESPVGFRKVGDGRSHFTLGGRGGGPGMSRALQRLAGVAPGMLFVSASTDASGAWTIEVETRDAWLPPLTVAGAARNVPVPPEKGLQTATTRRLRAEVDKLDVEIHALERLTGETAKLEERLAVVEYERARAKAPDSVGGVAPWVGQVFGPVLANGTVTLAGDTLGARGALAKGVDAAVLGSMARGKFEIVSVAPPNAEVRRLAVK